MAANAAAAAAAPAAAAAGQHTGAVPSTADSSDPLTFELEDPVPSVPT